MLAGLRRDGMALEVYKVTAVIFPEGMDETLISPEILSLQLPYQALSEFLDIGFSLDLLI